MVLPPRPLRVSAVIAMHLVLRNFGTVLLRTRADVAAAVSVGARVCNLCNVTWNVQPVSIRSTAQAGQIFTMSEVVSEHVPQQNDGQKLV